MAINDKKQISNAFAEHYTVKVTDDHTKQFIAFKNMYTTAPNRINSFYFEPVSSSDVSLAISQLKNTKSVGYDEISTDIIKHINASITKPLAFIINRSVQEGEFPDLLKINKTIPINKKGSDLLLDNYRLITIPSVLCKIIEKCISENIWGYLQKYDIVAKCQNGFVPGKSTESATADAIDCIYTLLDAGNYVGALFFDLSKAFDTIDIAIMEYKLNAIGFRGNVLQWLLSYMKFRRMYVEVNDTRSEMHEIRLGVPQGSVLGPLMFLLFVNDMSLSIKTKCLTLYADDTSVIEAANTPMELQEALNNTANQFTTWCKRNHLTVNASKTIFMHFHGKKKLDMDLTVRINDSDIMCSDQTKFLGVMVDKRLSWKIHLDLVCMRISKSYYAILRLKNIIEQKDLLNVYYALIHSLLSYNIILWGCCADINRILIVQKRIIRIMFNIKKMESCRPYFKQHSLLTVVAIYIFNCILFVKKKENEFEKCVGGDRYPIRNENSFKLPIHKTSTLEQSPKYAGLKFFNHLPKEIRNISNFKMFKHELRSFLCNASIYSIQEFYIACAL